MKKSKILMPLTGIAAIGAVAPVIAMSACHKNEYKIIADGTVGVYVGDTTGGYNVGATVCNTLGHETLEAAKTTGDLDSLAVKIKFNKPIEKGHVIKVKADHQGKDSAEGTIFYSKDIDETYVITSGIGQTEETFEFKQVVKLNTQKYAKWTKGDETESFTFKVTYSEYDSNKENAKLLGEQTYSYTINANNKLHDLAYVQGSTLTGKNPTGTIVSLGGWQLNKAAGQTVKVEFADKSEMMLYKNWAVKTKDWLKIDGNQAAQEVAETKQDISFVGGVDAQVPSTTGATFLPEGSVACDIVLHISVPENKYYVVDGWDVVVTIPATGVTVTQA